MVRRGNGAVDPAGSPHLEGQGDLLSRLVLGITGIIIWVIRAISILPKCP